jgi:TolB-like protein
MSLPSYIINRETRSLTAQGAPVTLGARAFDVLAYLDAHRDRVVSKAELLEQVWGGLAVEEGNLSVQISTLRKALGARAIATVPGVGYKLATDVAPSAVADGPSLPTKPSLAVLPFANLTGHEEQDYLVEGLVSELIAALSRIPALFVISGGSTFALQGRSVDLADVGRQLGVRYLLDGAIQQAGDQLRITVHLIEAETGRTIWTDRFTGATQDVFDLQDRLTDGVAFALEPSVLLAESARAERKTSNLDAYDLCLRAAPLAYRMTKIEDFDKARGLLEQAVVLDPDYTEAKALLCRLYSWACAGRFISFDAARLCVPICESILDTPDADPLSATVAVHALAFLDGQQRRGASVSQRMVQLLPNSSLLLTAAGWMQTYINEGDRALAFFERSLRLNPLDPFGHFTKLGIGAAHGVMGRYDEAIPPTEQALAEVPGYGTALQHLLIFYWHTGREAKAREMAAQLSARAAPTTISGYRKNIPYLPGRYLDDVFTAFRAVGLPEGET